MTPPPITPDYATSSNEECDRLINFATLLLIALSFIFALDVVQEIRNLVSVISLTNFHRTADLGFLISEISTLLIYISYVILAIIGGVQLRRGSKGRYFAAGIILMRLPHNLFHVISVSSQLVVGAVRLDAMERLKYALPSLLAVIAILTALRLLWLIERHPPTTKI